MANGCRWTSREVNAGALTCQDLDPPPPDRRGQSAAISPPRGLPQQALRREGGQEGTFILEHERNSFLKITSGLAGLLRPSRWPSISLSKYLEGGKVSRSSCALRSAGVGVSPTDPHLFRVSQLPPANPQGMVLPSPRPLQEPGPFCLPLLPTPHQTWGAPASPGEAGRGGDATLR